MHLVNQTNNIACTYKKGSNHLIFKHLEYYHTMNSKQHSIKNKQQEVLQEPSQPKPCSNIKMKTNNSLPLHTLISCDFQGQGSLNFFFLLFFSKRLPKIIKGKTPFLPTQNLTKLSNFISSQHQKASCFFCGK